MTWLTRAVLGLQAGLIERYLIQLYPWSLCKTVTSFLSPSVFLTLEACCLLAVCQDSQWQ